MSPEYRARFFALNKRLSLLVLIWRCLRTRDRTSSCNQEHARVELFGIGGHEVPRRSRTESEAQECVHGRRPLVSTHQSAHDRGSHLQRVNPSAVHVSVFTYKGSADGCSGPN